jgi:YOP proteins translocation protein K (YscK)
MVYSVKSVMQEAIGPFGEMQAKSGYDYTDVQRSWAKAVIRFNIEPAYYAHPSWLPNWTAKASHQSLVYLSRALLAEQELTNCFDWEMPFQAARLFLLEPRALANVALSVGVASHRDQIRQIIRKEQIMLLRSALGETLDTLWLPFAQVIPKSDESLQFHWECFSADALKKNLINTGYFQLLTLLDPSNQHERPCAVRASFCVPKEIRKIQSTVLTENQRIGLTKSIIIDIIPKQASAWTWLF